MESPSLDYAEGISFSFSFIPSLLSSFHTSTDIQKSVSLRDNPQ